LTQIEQTINDINNESWIDPTEMISLGVYSLKLSPKSGLIFAILLEKKSLA